MSTVTAPTQDVSSKKRNLVEMNWDPITRIVGSLGIFTKIDFENRHVVECHSTSSIFRGYSIFMKGKDPRDAHFITSRICGICGDNHATCATYAQNMAFGVKPPPIAEWIVNLGEAAEYMFDHNIFQDNLVGVDFCEQMVKETNPKAWTKAQSTPAPHANAHGYRTIADIMTALNPFIAARPQGPGGPPRHLHRGLYECRKIDALKRADEKRRLHLGPTLRDPRPEKLAAPLPPGHGGGDH
jgi:hydrogenase large subunit